MKISIWGVTADRGLPLAYALRVYGRHSVVGYDPDLLPPGGHPDRELQELRKTEVPIPIAPGPRACCKEGGDLAIVAAHWGRIQTMLDNLFIWAPHTPVVIVTPLRAPILAIDTHMTVGLAPFTFRPETVLSRLLTLRQITVRRVTPAQPGVQLVDVLYQAWAPIDNRIPILEKEARDGAGPVWHRDPHHHRSDHLHR